MKTPPRVLLSAWVTLTAAAVCLADTVHTSDGSRLVGKIELMAEGKLVIVGEVFGRVEVDASKIVAIAIDEPLTVEFESGDRLIGTIRVADDQTTSVMRTEIGDVAVPIDRIKLIWPLGGENPEVTALKAEAARRWEALRPHWSATLEAGGTRTEGNTDTLVGRGRFDLKRTTTDDLLHFYLAAEFGEQDKRRTTNEYRGGVRYDSKLTDKWFWYTRTELEFDEFEDLDLRATATAGGGYAWWSRPDHELKNRMGFGYRHEAYDGGRTVDSAVADVGLDYRFDLAPWVRFTHTTSYAPDVERFEDYRVDIDTALTFPFEDKRFKLKIGMRNEYNSKPQPGFDRLDNSYYANIVFDLVR